jgi:four helix bundle protein
VSAENENIDSKELVREPLNDRYSNNAIIKRCLDFSVNLVGYCELLEKDRKFVISKQLLASGTSIGANSIEAQNAESTKHFISKFKIAIREADETAYWLEICLRSKSYQSPPADLSLELEANTRMINKIISTSTKHLK